MIKEKTLNSLSKSELKSNKTQISNILRNFSKIG
jgi:hypothetical protein